MRAIFVNSGFLGHRVVGRLVRAAVAALPDVDASHIDLSSELTLFDRAVRRLLSLPLAPSSGPAANLDLRRWREEMNVGLLARRRIDRIERRVGAADLLHFHTQAAAYASLDRMARTPTIVSIDATQRLASLELPGSLARLTYRPNASRDARVFRSAAAIISTSAWAARDLARSQPDCAAKTRVLPYPVDLAAFDPAWTAERRARPGTARPRAVFVGGDFPRKGGFDLLEAWRAGAFGARATLDLVTDFPLDPRSLPDGVRVVRGIAPYSDAWREMWRGADLFVMPTRSEAFGMVFQEAAAAGLPAIGTRINAIPELIDDGATGMLVDPGDRRALAAALDHLIADAAGRVALGGAARQRIERVGAPDVYARQLAAIIQELVAHRELRRA
ncbi:MAG TPA: glycosyltransferase family 4 protein [Vicinamibacterales bacterium]|nr:glycosyltransferase family 4 protein [Vicinamibacterales bacterium]